MRIPQSIPPSPSPAVSTSLCSASLSPPCKEVQQWFFWLHAHALIRCVSLRLHAHALIRCVSLWLTAPCITGSRSPRWLEPTQIHPFLRSDIPLFKCTRYSSVDGQLACFPVLAVVKTAAMNTGAHMSFRIVQEPRSKSNVLQRHQVASLTIRWHRNPGQRGQLCKVK